MNRHWKKLTAFLTAGVMLLPIVAACSKQESKNDPQAYRAQFQSTAENRLLDAAEGVQAVKTLESEGNTLISVDCPSVQGNADVSARLKEFADGALAEFRTAADAARSEKENADKVFEYTMTYKPYVIQGGLFSVKFTTNSKLIEPDKINYVDAFAYDLGTGQQLAVADLFDTSQDYLNVLSRETQEYLMRNEILRKNMDESLFAQGTAANEANFSNFAITPEKILFFFNRGTIAPTEAGTFEVGIPLAKVDELLNAQIKAKLNAAGMAEGGDEGAAASQASPGSAGATPAGPADTDIKQLRARDGFMPARSIDGIDPMNDKVIALTFDDGPHETLTPELLQILKDNDVVATFFVVGTNVEKYPELVKQAYEQGNDIGTHSWNHPADETWKNMSVDEKLEQYRKANDAIEAATGLRALFDRPPGGRITEKEAAQLGREQILWSMDPKDWKKANRDPDTIYTNVIEGGEGTEGKIADGGVILSHDIHASTVQAYDRIIKELKAEGYRFVTISQMMQIADARGEELKYMFYNAPTAAQAQKSESGAGSEEE